ncbi:hypothetical protein OIE71_00500 [Streptomyces sp. NBC_01725]|uniref:hypothetical protein n=1 Tax=Streptomyces sp. NBC_01725 TaxID=2975923 RepID=UPI002E2E46E7|nr:hypothetical protein [Streptomyces sp. NBC_01725]
MTGRHIAVADAADEGESVVARPVSRAERRPFARPVLCRICVKAYRAAGSPRPHGSARRTGTVAAPAALVPGDVTRPASPSRSASAHTGLGNGPRGSR